MEVAQASSFSFECSLQRNHGCHYGFYRNQNNQSSYLNDLFSSGGMEGDAWNDLAYHVCYGFWRDYGCYWSTLLELVMHLLSWAQTTFQLFASTVQPLA